MAVEKPIKNVLGKAGKVIQDVKNLPGFGVAALDLGGNIVANVLSGDNLGTATLKAIPESIAWAVAPKIMTGVMVAQLLPAAVTGYINADAKLKSRFNENHKAGTMFTYTDTRAALTMRQAAIQAIQGSKMNARNALGGEAALMHRGWGDRLS